MGALRLWLGDRAASGRSTSPKPTLKRALLLCAVGRARLFAHPQCVGPGQRRRARTSVRAGRGTRCSSGALLRVGDPRSERLSVRARAPSRDTPCRGTARTAAASRRMKRWPVAEVSRSRFSGRGSSRSDRSGHAAAGAPGGSSNVAPAGELDSGTSGGTRCSSAALHRSSDVRRVCHRHPSRPTDQTLDRSTDAGSRAALRPCRERQQQYPPTNERHRQHPSRQSPISRPVGGGFDRERCSCRQHRSTSDLVQRRRADIRLGCPE
jgi:hypothetical protein